MQFIIDMYFEQIHTWDNTPHFIVSTSYLLKVGNTNSVTHFQPFYSQIGYIFNYRAMAPWMWQTAAPGSMTSRPI